jgi:hypothetical protein
MAHTRFRIDLLGGVRVREGDRVITHVETRKTAALLAYLAYYPQRIHPREVLTEILWPEDDPEATRARLRQALAALRRAVDPRGPPAPRPLGDALSARSLLITDRAGVRLDAGAVTTDVSEFEKHLRLARQSTDPAVRLPFGRSVRQLPRPRVPQPGGTQPLVSAAPPGRAGVHSADGAGRGGRLQRRLIERAAGPPENGTIPLRLKKSLRLGRWAPESGDAAKGWLVA